MLSVDIKGRLGAFDLDAEFQAGLGITALYGPSGAGKSSILRAIAGLWLPEKGQVQIGDTVLLDTESGINIPTEKRRLGVVFQEPLLFPHMSVKQNLKYGEDQAAGRWDTVVSLLELQNLLDRMPRNLSGGEAQRVAIGRALLTNPQILLLDEPLTGLDDARREKVLPYLEKIRAEANMPILYVSHNGDEISRLADKVIMIENGSAAEPINSTEFQRAINLPPALKRDRA